MPALTTHFVEMSFGDIFSGLLQMYGEMVLQSILNAIGNAIGGPFKGNAGAVVTGLLLGINFCLGSPLGMDASTFGIWGKDAKGDNIGGPIDKLGKFMDDKAEAAGQAVGKYLDGGLPNGYPKDFGDYGGDDYE